MIYRFRRKISNWFIEKLIKLSVNHAQKKMFGDSKDFGLDKFEKMFDQSQTKKGDKK